MATKLSTIRAFAAAMAPYALPKSTCEFLLLEQGLDAEADYTPGANDKSFYSAVIEGLNKVKSLKKESDPGTENDYDTSKIDEMIGHYRQKYDLEEEDSAETFFIDRTGEW